MKKFISLVLVLVFVFVPHVKAANIDDVVSGQTLDLDGNSQRISFFKTAAFKKVMAEEGYIEVWVYVSGASGLRVSNIPINDSVHALFPQGVWTKATITADNPYIYIKGNAAEFAFVAL